MIITLAYKYLSHELRKSLPKPSPKKLIESKVPLTQLNESRSDILKVRTYLLFLEWIY